MAFIAITQPNFLPWMGYFEMASRVDQFVMLDDVQFSKNDWINRNKIYSHNEPNWQWLTVPVAKGRLSKPINQTIPLVDERVYFKIEKTISSIYKKTEYFDNYFPELRQFLNTNYGSIADLNISLIKCIYKWLGIPDNIVLSSSLNVEGEKTVKLIEICKKLNAKSYLANNGSSSYIEEDLFRVNCINFQYQNFLHPSYSGFSGRMHPKYLSILDALFFYGPDTASMINRKA